MFFSSNISYLPKSQSNSFLSPLHPSPHSTYHILQKSSIIDLSLWWNIDSPRGFLPYFCMQIFLTFGYSLLDRSSQNENGLYLHVCPGRNAQGRMENRGSEERCWSQKYVGPNSLKNRHDLARVLLNLSKLHFSLSRWKQYRVIS